MKQQQPGKAFQATRQSEDINQQIRITYLTELKYSSGQSKTIEAGDPRLHYLSCP